MEKVVFVAFADDDAPGLEPGSVISHTERLSTSLDAARYPELSLQVEDREATMRWQRRTEPMEGRLAAVLSTWTECADETGDVEAAVAQLSDDYAAYVVTEAVPRWNTDRSTSATEPVPGVIVTSLLGRAASMNRAEFEAHWQHVHQPMSLRIHPQWTYVRNLVARTLTPNAPDVDAVCEEGFAMVDDVLEPERFYGADVTNATWQQNAETIGDDVPLFLDMANTTSTIMREYRLRTFRR